MFTASAYRFLLASLSIVLFCGAGDLTAQHIHTCTVMPLTEAPASTTANPNLPFGVQKAVSYKPGQTQSNLWTPGSTVTVRFLGGTAALQNRVMRYANEWTQFANLRFQVVSSGYADVRVGFTQDGSSWSMVGRSSARANQNSPSMNFGWLNDRTADAEVRRTVLHEFGHALGLLHEHQNPAGGIPWNEEAVYAHYLRTQGWDRRTTYHNVMATASHDATQYSSYDASSIMHYPVDARLTNGNYEVGMNSQLSYTDRQYIARLYPGRPVATTTTAPSRPPVTRPSGRTTPTRSTPTATRPRPVPARRADARSVRISNSLGDNQTAETVELYVARKKYVIKLDRNGRMQQTLDLQLQPGNYPYRVVTNSTYRGYRTVERNGRRYRQPVSQTIPGDGSGTLTVSNDLALTLYGSYDKQRQRMKVYLGASK